MRKIEILCIDPQNDFCNPKGSLFVPGADADSVRLAAMLVRLKDKIHDIHVTLDTHHLVDIAHPIMWKDSDGNHPSPFTIITEDDIIKGVWTTTNPRDRDRALAYAASLKKNGRYPLCVWPPHCLIGSWGHNVQSDVYAALLEWEKGFAMVDYVTKGSNMYTEHYSAVQADVPDPSDPSTMLNLREGGIIRTLQNADVIGITGQALSHCVANTVRDIANNFGEDNIKKLVLLTDTTSSVHGFEKMGADFVTEMVGRGMQTALSTEFFK